MKVILLALSALIIFGCNKQQCENSMWVNATVLNTRDMNCNVPVLSFKEDSVKVCAFTGYTQSANFGVHGLPAQCNVQGATLQVEIARETPDRCNCLALGFGYPALKILNAKYK